MWRRRPSRRALAVALAVLAVAIGAVLAVPSARTAVLEWLGIKGVDIVRVEKLPSVSPFTDLELGERVTLAEARRRAPYELAVPRVEGLGAPDAIFAERLPGGAFQVSFLWGTRQHVRLLVSEFDGMAIAEKLIAPDTKAERVQVEGGAGVWFEGAPHAFVYRRGADIREETFRLVENALVWQRGSLTMRLEGDVSKRQALEVAGSVR
jgi:hypothetical protein